MKIVDPPQRFDSMEAFYADNDERRGSDAFDFGGGHWTEPHEVGWTFPRSRLSWIAATGELIVVRYSVLGSSLPTPVKVIAICASREELEHALEGWEQHCEAEGLGFVYSRLQRAVRNGVEEEKTA